MFRMDPQGWWGRAGVSALFRQSGGAVKEAGNAAQPFRADVKGAPERVYLSEVKVATECARGCA